MPDLWIKELIDAFCDLFPPGTILSYGFMVRALAAVIMVGLICGSVGSVVVGNRMAFFSDALAHTAFAGVALGLLVALLSNAVPHGSFYEVGIPLIMVAFGVANGLGIAYVREKTGLASDTVIGVFFAFAIGFGAILLSIMAKLGRYRVENFLWGDVFAANETRLTLLLLLGLITLGVLLFMYNQVVFVSFNPSLALSRNISVRLCNYLFIALLAMIVNISLAIVGALLINAMLVVPAATACNLCSNLRHLFWVSVTLCVSVGILGVWMSFAVKIPMGGQILEMTPSGLIVVILVLLFFISMAVGPWIKGRPQSAPALVPDAK